MTRTFQTVNFERFWLIPWSSRMDIGSSRWKIEEEFLFFFFQPGWNHRFNRLVAKYHPNVWNFFDCLKKEKVCVRQQMLKIMMDRSKQINKKAAAIQERIYSLEWQFKEKQINIGGLLEGLSLLIGTQNWYF